MNFDEILSRELVRWNLGIPVEVRHQLSEYASELERWNRAVNLTALNGEALVRRLIVEPIWVGGRLQMSGTLVDVGSGNGSPGIPLSVTREFERVVLVEPRLRRAAFLRHIVAKLSLRNIEVARDRIENLPGPVAADWISMQAIEPTEDILVALNRIRKETTRVVWFTSRDLPPVSGAEEICPPRSSSKIWVFQLDQT